MFRCLSESQLTVEVKRSLVKTLYALINCSSLSLSLSLSHTHTHTYTHTLSVSTIVANRRNKENKLYFYSSVSQFFFFLLSCPAVVCNLVGRTRSILHLEMADTISCAVPIEKISCWKMSSIVTLLQSKMRIF